MGPLGLVVVMLGRARSPSPCTGKKFIMFFKPLFCRPATVESPALLPLTVEQMLHVFTSKVANDTGMCSRRPAVDLLAGRAGDVDGLSVV